VARSANGIDIGAVYDLLTQMSGRLDSHDRKFDQLLRVINEHGRKLDGLTAGLSDFRSTVTNYHSAVLGHGILISELDERVRRIERHLKLEPSAE
jgi:hypothetical protein